MKNMKNIALIPIDNRPICTTLIEQICAVDKDIKLFMPDRNLLGGLNHPSNKEEILSWLENLNEKIDYLIVSLDTIAYGGLITSRRCDDSFEEIIKRVDNLKDIIKEKNCKTFAFSSIMRISNNNVNEEEKIYWSDWGKKIFEYSYNFHKEMVENNKEYKNKEIKKEILDDYLKTRDRNFKVNKYYLSLKDTFDYIVFSKDDTGKYGLNVYEAQQLQEIIVKNNLNGIVKTGADEIPLSLLSKALVGDKKIKIKPTFLEENSVNKISKYEDITVFNCVKDQIELAGCIYQENECDIEALINNFKDEQGDLVLGDLINKTENTFKAPTKPRVYIDINNSNGADDNFIKNIMEFGYSDNFYGYAGYNTSANSIGCALCITLVKFLSKNYDENAFKKLIMTRFLDDWAYQAHIRKSNEDFKPFEDKINDFLKTEYKNIKYTKPWNRTFEIEISF